MHTLSSLVEEPADIVLELVDQAGLGTCVLQQSEKALLVEGLGITFEKTFTEDQLLSLGL